MNEKPWVKTYAGGKPNYCTPEVTGEVTTEVPCKTDPRAPHGFDRNASHSADRYVCECESWEPVDNVYMSEERVYKTDKSVHEPQKRSFSEDVGRLLSTGKGFYADGTPIDPKEINIKIEGVGDGVVTCTEVHLPSPPQKEWVGLSDEEKENWKALGLVGVEIVAAHLKEKNT